MPKRKQISVESPAKKQKIIPRENSPTITKETSHTSENENVAWSNKDIITLLTKIEENIPVDDTISYSCRLNKLNWENMTFETHTSIECKQVWSTLYKQVRKFRLLKELVADMKEIVLKPNLSPLKKNPDKPKQPHNSYMLFVDDKRQEIVNENPTLSLADVGRKLGAMFKALPPEEKQKYEEESKIAREEYAEKLQVFYEKHPELMPKKNRKKSVIQKGPVKPKTPFELFFKVESEKEGEVSVSIQKYRERWNKLSNKEKYFWINWAEEQYEKYLVELKEYLKTHPNDEPEKLKSILNKKEKEIKEYCCGKPEKPPHSSYHLFSKMLLESAEVRGMNSRELMNYVSEKWRNCSDDEKNEYRVRTEQMWEEYRQKLDKYLMTLNPEERDKVLEEGKRKKDNKTEEKTVTPGPAVKQNRPEMPPMTKYKYFVKHYHGGDDPRLIWKKMSSAEKQIHQEKLDEERRVYIQQYEKYLKTLSREELQKIGASLGDQCYSESSESESTSED